MAQIHRPKAAKKVAAYWAWPCAGAFFLLRSWGAVSYLVANPGSFSLRSLGLCLGHLLDCGFVLVLFAGFYHWGAKLCRRLAPAGPWSSLEGGLCACVVGEAMAAALIMALGLLGLYRYWILVLPFLALAYGALQERAALGSWGGRLRASFVQKVSVLDLICLVVLWSALLSAVAATGSPVTEWDTLGYHLALPKIYLAQGALRRLAWSAFAHSPQNSEMIYLLALALRRGLAAQWVNFGHGVLFALSAYVLCRRHVSRRAGLLAAAILVSQPVVQRVAGGAMNDFAAASSALLALVVFLRGRREREEADGRRLYLLCGCLSGIALSHKFNGLWAAGSVFILIGAESILRRERRSWPGLIAFLAGGACFGLPWYFRNLVIAGNPVWPYYGEWFHASAPDLAVWHRIWASYTTGVAKTWLNYLALPWHLVFSPERFNYSPHYLVAAFLPLALWRCFAGRWRPAETRAVAFLAIFGSVWFLSVQEWRFMLVAAAILAVLIAGWSCRALRDGRPQVRVLAAAALLALLPCKSLGGNNHLFAFLNLESKAAPGTTPPERYLELTLGAPYVVLRSANKILPPEAKVLFFRDARGYYLDRAYAYGDPLNAGSFSYAEIRDSAELRRTLARLGFSHVFYNPTIGGYQGDQGYYARCDRLMEEMLRAYGEPLVVAGPIGLYRLLNLPRESGALTLPD